MAKLNEAATVKARARGLLRDAHGLLGDKALPKAIKDAIEGLRAALKKTWQDLEADAEGETVQEAGDWGHDEVRLMLQRSVDAQRQPTPTVAMMTWVQDVHDDWFVYQDDATGKLYKRSYAIDDKGTVTLGEPVEVVAQRVYVPASEAAILESGFVPLVEKAVRKDGTIPIRVIAPGWGSSGHYSSEVLKRDGPTVFTKGLKMYWNHPTPTEESERPERDLRDLAATLVSDARYEEQGPAGPGLYADAQVFGPYREAINELAPHIGVSIRALGRAKQGAVEGKTGPIIEEIVTAKSVDFVTTPGAGGQVLQLFEAAGRGPAAQSEEVTVTEQEAQELRERNAALQAEVARLKEAITLREAKSYVGEVLAGIEMPAMTRARLTESLSANPVLKDGALDRDAYKAQIEEAARAELKYLAEVSGSGRITGMGNGGQQADDKAQLVEAFKRTGLSDEQAAIAAAGR